MITKIYFQITDSESINFDSDVNMSVEEYDALILDKFQQDQYMMKDFERQGFGAKKNLYYNPYDDEIKEENNTKDKYTRFSECEALIKRLMPNKTYIDATLNDFIELNESGKMGIMNININPNSIEYQAESEIRLWIGDSNRINADRSLDNRTKFGSLPKIDIKVSVNEDTYFLLKNCKIIENNSNKSFPFDLVIAIEEIINV